MKHRAKGFSVLSAAAAVLLLAQSGRPQGTSSLHKRTLDNGLTLVTQQDGASAVTVFEILIRGGQRADPAGLEGLAYLTTRLSLEIPDMSKVQELMEKSSRYLMAAKGDYSVIHIECLSEFLEDTLAVFTEILKDPLFSGVRINGAKDYIDNQRKIESDDNLNLGHLVHLRTFLGRLGCGGSVFGTEESLKKIKGRDIEAFYADRFAPSNLTVLAVSDLDDERLAGLLKKFFGGFSRVKSEKRFMVREPEISAEKAPVTVLEKDTRQALVSLGFALPPATPRNYALSALLEGLLGKGPGSLLWPLRTEMKLAYNVNAQTTLVKDGGILEAFLETDALKTETARDALKNTLADLHQKGISGEVLEETKIFVRSNFLRSNETKDRRISTICYFEALGLGSEYYETYLTELSAVTAEEFNRYIKDVLDPDKSALVIVGPKTK